MTLAARKILLPRFVVTELAYHIDEDAIRIPLPDGSRDKAYYIRPKQDELGKSERLDGKPRWMGSRFNLFPIVLDAQGAPWAEATVYILARVEGSLSPAMITYASIADSLAAYRRYLDETEIDWMHFPAKKFNRPTYRYRS